MIRAYLRRSLPTLALTLTLTALFTGVCLLYGLPLEAAGYCAMLGGFLLLLAGMIGYPRFRTRVRELEAAQQFLENDLPVLPAPADRLEADYQALIHALCADRARRTAQDAQNRQEQRDYYTLWAHQIKTPLSAMRLLLRAPGEAPVPELEAELLQMERYVDMALSYQRLDSESTDFSFAWQSLAPIVRGVVRKLARLFVLKHIALTLPPLETRVLTDSKWLAFVLEQLLTNALKYTPEGGTISFRMEGQQLTLSDSGIGIRAEDLPRIFEKGFTGFNGRQETRSTGLGLYLCKRVLDKLGHGIAVTSTPGTGTQVTLTFSSEHPSYE